MTRIKHRTIGFGLLLGTWGWLLAMDGAMAQTTNAASTGSDFNSFRLIGERNIFNARRSGVRSTTAPRETRRVAVVETVSLVGTFETGPDTVAFFDGSSAGVRKAVKVGGQIAGYTITRVNFDGVELETGGRKIELRVGSGLRREDGGEWEVTTTVTLVNSTSSRDGGNAPAGRDSSSREAGRDSIRDSGRGTSRGGRDNRDQDSSRRERETDSARSGESSGASAPATGASDSSPEEVLRRLKEQRERENQ